MLQFEGWKKTLVLFVILLGCAYAVPNLFNGSRSDQSTAGVMRFLPGEAINLGLDLQGGSHLLLRADLPAVREERLEGIAEQLRLSFRDKKIRFKGLKASRKAVTFTLRKTENETTLQNIFDELGREFQVVNEDLKYNVSFSEAGLQLMADNTVEQAIEIIRRRLDPDGTKEPIIQRQGRDRVLIQLPGIDDPERIKRLLGQTARLTFQLVDTRTTADEAKRTGRIPPGSQLLESVNKGESDYIVEKRVMVSGEMLENASAAFDQNRRPSVNFQLNAAGGRKFGRVTA